MEYLLGIGIIFLLVVVAMALLFAASTGLRRLLPLDPVWQQHLSPTRTMERATFLLKNMEAIGVLLLCALMVAIGLMYS